MWGDEVALMNWSLFLNKRGGGGGWFGEQARCSHRRPDHGRVVEVGGLVNKRGGKSAESELFGTQVARVPEAEYAHA